MNILCSKSKICYRLIADTLADRLKRLEANTIFTNSLLLIAFHFRTTDFIVRMFVTVYVNVLAYFINDFIDVEIDLKAEDKDHAKALFIKENKRTAFALIVFMSTFILIFTLFYSKSICFGVILVLFVIFIYTDYFKNRAYLDIFGCFLWGMALPWIAIPDFSLEGIKYILLLGLFSCCTEIAQCVKDYESDKKYGLKTTPIVLGIPKTFLLAKVIYVVAAAYTLFVLRQFAGLFILIPVFFSTSQPVTQYWFKLRIVFGMVWFVIMVRIYFGT